ncbi:hypothetical protein BT69DRAFT_1276580 [Atractiella rhizophila]|nr:hypothetical protein BT69DRAFT_1276580 [Atractiella rhizophila]
MWEEDEFEMTDAAAERVETIIPQIVQHQPSVRKDRKRRTRGDKRLEKEDGEKKGVEAPFMRGIDTNVAPFLV